ncbi:MAG: DHHA1 domain-containing protein, partial [Bacteroidetes bacterium]|nr:DHHA1 domain-containing protein [Bacteroidota bacterium]
LTGKIFATIFDLFVEAYRSALEESSVRSFDAVQIGIMDSEEFENRANIATKIADRLGLTGIPAIRSETASSTGELVYELMDSWNLDTIDTAMASALYVAIMTDTGSFRFSNVTADVHRLIGDLIERGGLDSAQIHADVYDRRSAEGIRLLSQVLATLEIHHDGNVGSMIISRRSLHETGSSIEEAEGFVNHILSIEGVRVGLLFTETQRGTKVSFRSKAGDHVHKWAQALGGGGHRNAAGAFVRKPLEKTIRLVVDKAPKFIELSYSKKSSDGKLPAEDAEYLSSLLNVEHKGSEE